MQKNIIILIITVLGISSCKKDFLDAKPSSSIVIPSTLNDFTAILDNADIMNVTGALSQMASDEYFLTSQSVYDALPTLTEKNSFIWNKDLFGGEIRILDWNSLNTVIFYSNSVLSELAKSELANTPEGKNIQGWAMFYRAYALHDLARNFSEAYDNATANSELGVPLRLSPDIDVLLPRASLQQTYDQIIADLKSSVDLLTTITPNQYRNRPTRVASFAALSRVYLSMRDYNSAEAYADSCLKYYNKLINYNSISQTSTTPFTYTSDEIIFFSRQIIAYSSLTSYSTTALYSMDSMLIKLYGTNDLRKPIYFRANTYGYFAMKRGYVGGGSYPFTGLATDEIYLIKAECAARRSDISTAISHLNNVLSNRYKTGTFVPITAVSASDALIKVLEERKKELVWRSLRWSDLKRLNLEGANITVKRQLNNQTYTLPANDRRYTFPIPDDEIVLSGIEQNDR